jgi:membrane protein YdbS with pleckstrin-like domain
MRRRLKSTTFILVSQILLIALAFAWLLQMAIIAKEGSAYFIENNNMILYGEISAAFLIIVFGLYILITQMNRLGERRASDRGDKKPGSLQN